jgi:hypothetical protein
MVPEPAQHTHTAGLQQNPKGHVTWLGRDRAAEAAASRFAMASSMRAAAFG